MEAENPIYIFFSDLGFRRIWSQLLKRREDPAARLSAVGQFTAAIFPAEKQSMHSSLPL